MPPPRVPALGTCRAVVAHCFPILGDTDAETKKRLGISADMLCCHDPRGEKTADVLEADLLKFETMLDDMLESLGKDLPQPAGPADSESPGAGADKQ